MPDHRTLASADVHEPKWITTATTADTGKVITPSSSTSGVSELRKLLMADLDSSSVVQNVTPIAASTVTQQTVNELVYMTPAGVLATLTFQFATPSSCRPGQPLTIISTQDVTALTLSGTYSGATTALTANTAVKYINQGNTWIKV